MKKLAITLITISLFTSCKPGRWIAGNQPLQNLRNKHAAEKKATITLNTAAHDTAFKASRNDSTMVH